MKILIGALIAIGVLTNSASAQTVQKLPDPVKTGGLPLMEAIAARKSSKSFTNKEIDNQTLSEILWVAYGINRDEDKRTIPTAQNKKDLEVYVIKADGAWRYDAVNNSLIQVNNKNLLSDHQTQDYMKDVPVVLVFSGSTGKDWAALHAGSAYQNVGLYTASKGMKNVVRGYFDKKTTNKSLSIPKGQSAVITQAIGW